eukprot:gene22772-biopygen13310
MHLPGTLMECMACPGRNESRRVPGAPRTIEFEEKWTRPGRNGSGRGPDAGRTIEFKETDADRTRAWPCRESGATQRRGEPLMAPEASVGVVDRPRVAQPPPNAVETRAHDLPEPFTVPSKQRRKRSTRGRFGGGSGTVRGLWDPPPLRGTARSPGYSVVPGTDYDCFGIGVT